MKVVLCNGKHQSPFKSYKYANKSPQFNRHRFTIMADFCPGILYAIVWFLLALIIGWPVAGILACICILLMPFGACIPPLESFIEVLLKFVKLPLTWAKKGVAMAPLSDCSLD
ncbi:unnamed protein product [Hymenolepis diminuta]|uniref:Uncharacterized protein n=1 Tax=Hymenolepis diminuta TaxID=6216 RepID=A0A564XZ43_HYMDI|nr:unnamed protein product [Hymenolepis diminuta]VUZ40272.1 unnamed protein product [Hymenolepis diminuta]VUZ45866.1 unnamed protein product [Hymenolepis diminuta]